MVHLGQTSALTRFAKAVQLWPLERLRPYERNPRTHDTQQVQQIAASIARFGFTNPILVDSESGILAGHGRLLAARQLGLTEVPVIVLDYLSEAERRAYILADNQLATLADWDEDLLASELAALQAEGFPLELIGFSEQELAGLLDGELVPGGREGEDDAPEAPALAVSRPGDLWLCGEHRVLCGDATKPEAISQLLAREVPRLVFTDPPYNVDYQGVAGSIANDALGDAFRPFLETAIRNFLAPLQGAAYICMSSSEIDTLKLAFAAAGGHWSTFVVWAKNTFTLGRADYQRQYELILYGWPEGRAHYWCGARDQGDLWSISKPAANDLHPTMKPVELVRRAVLNSSTPGVAVLDPFGGSGTTMIACEETGRRARLLELDPRFVDVIVQRWQQFAGRQAHLAASRETFTQVAEQRDGAS